MTVKLTGLNINHGADFERGFTILAFGDVEVPAMDMTLRGCALSKMGAKLVALPPKSPGRRPGDPDAIHWDAHGAFAKLVCEAMITGYKALGGKMPAELEKREARRACD